MDYREIIKDNCENHSKVSWWPRFAFHYTDVKNAVSILSSGYLYSRTNAQKSGLMHNDNASRQVIDMTMTEAAANVRFYFRPLTPTQYHNEGYKHPSLRYDGDNKANVPVPVFFVFNLEKLLNMADTKFSQLAQSGYGSQLYHTADDFAKFNFDKIYNNEYDENWQENQKYRHAEILYPNKFEINSCIAAILCRNEIEWTTLHNLLKHENPAQYYRYRSMIKLCRQNMFENNGLFVTQCQLHDNTISFEFSNTPNKVRHSCNEMRKNGLTSLDPVQVRIVLIWTNRKGVCHKTTIDTQIDYLAPKTLTFTNLPDIPAAKTICIKLYFENDLMCCMEQSLADAEVIR